jgi:hypothetical protein
MVLPVTGQTLTLKREPHVPKMEEDSSTLMSAR